MLITIGLWQPPSAAHAPPQPVVFYIMSHNDLDVKYAEKMLTIYDMKHIQTFRYSDMVLAREYARRTYGLDAFEFKKLPLNEESTGTYQYNPKKGTITKRNE